MVGTGRSSGDVAVRRFHLDYVGAHVAEDLCGEWAEHDSRQIDHANAGERAALHLSLH